MTQLLEQVFAEVRKLPEPEQDAIATLILEDLTDEPPLGRSLRPLAGPAGAAGRKSSRGHPFRPSPRPRD